MSSEIDEDTDCSVWAKDVENKVATPTGEIPIKDLPDLSEYDGLFEGGSILSEYEKTAETMQTLHEEWREVALEWSRRMDQLFAQIVVLERTLRDEGAAPPTDDFEELTSRVIGFYVATVLGAAQGSWSISRFAAERLAKKKRFASVGTQTSSVRSASSNLSYSSGSSSATARSSAPSATSASSVARGVRASKISKLKTVGRVAVGAGTVLSMAIIAVDLVNRNTSLKQAIPKFHKWLYGPDDDDPENLIATPDITTEEITVGGAAGRILEMQRAVQEIHEAIRTLARLQGIATGNPDGTDRDMNLVYCETRQAVGDDIYDASQVMASTRVATRMLCIDKWTEGVSYTDGQIAAVTGLSTFEIGALRTQVAADEEGALCKGIAPGNGGT